MTEHDLDHYLGDQAAFDALSDEEKARLFIGQSSQGETEADSMTTATAEPSPDESAEESGESPGTAAQRETRSDAGREGGAVREEPVVLAKDGRHTIPYQELLAARERAQQMESLAREQAALIERMRQHPEGAVQAADADAPSELERKEHAYLERLLSGDRHGAVRIRNEINAEIRRQSEEEAAAHALKQTARAVSLHEAQRLLHEAAQRTLAAYPYLNDNEAAIAEVVEWRDFYMMKGAPPHQAVELAAAKVAPAWRAQPPVSDSDSRRQTGAKGNAARVKAPLSLSDVPAGTAAPHDEIAALRDMSGAGLMQRFAGKTPEQIMELMNRLI